jgi:hypothetical protein
MTDIDGIFRAAGHNVCFVTPDVCGNSKIDNPLAIVSQSHRRQCRGAATT